MIVRPRAVVVVLAAVVAPLTLSGCTGTDTSAARATATAYAAALAAGQPDAVCGLLAPAAREELAGSGSGSCPAGLRTAQLPRPGSITEVAEWGEQAMVRLRGDTVFLARFPQGWRVEAAGCRPRGDRPYDCMVQGG